MTLRDYFTEPLDGHRWTGRPYSLCECGWDDQRRCNAVGIHEAFREHARELDARGEQMGLFA